MMRCLYVSFGERYILIKDGREGGGGEEKWDLSLLIFSSANRKDAATSRHSIFDDYLRYIFVLYVYNTIYHPITYPQNLPYHRECDMGDKSKFETGRKIFLLFV